MRRRAAEILCFDAFVPESHHVVHFVILSWGSQPLHNTGLVGNTRPVGLLNVGEDVPRSRQPGGSNGAFRSEL